MADKIVAFNDQKPGLGLPQPLEERVAEQYASEASDSVHAQKKLMGKKLALVLRHDDVQADALRYLPLYDELGVKATWYVVTQHMGTTQRGIIHASESDIVALHKDGHEIGSHTQTHLYFDQATEAQRRAEMAGSKRDLEELLGGAYRCETFAYPGNWGSYDKEVGDYYIWGTSGVPTTDIYGQTHTLTDIDTISNEAEYPQPLVGATVAETITKTQALLTEFKAREALTIYTLQTHNLNEVPLDHMRAILETILADNTAEVVTMREAAHFVRSTLATRDGRFYAPHGITSGDPARQVTLVGTKHSDGGHIVDRVTSFGRAFVAKVGGETVANLDSKLEVLTSGTSRLEKGHRLQLFDPTNTTSMNIGQEDGGIFTLNLSASAARSQHRGSFRVTSSEKALQVYNTIGTDIFRVDTDRMTFQLRQSPALPTSQAAVGEVCNVLGTLYICRVAGTPGVWEPINNPRGTTGQRPGAPTAGLSYFDITLGKPIWWNGTGWVDAAGTAV